MTSSHLSSNPESANDPAAVTLHELAAPAHAGAPVHPLAAAYHRLRGQADLETYGHLDFHENLASFHAGMVPNKLHLQRRWVAVPAGADPEHEGVSVVGVALLHGEHSDNTHAGTAYCYVAPSWRGRGIGRLLVERLAEALAEEGRTTVAVWLTSADRDELGPLIPAKSGVGGVRRDDPGVRLLTRLGFELEQVEAQSTLDVPAPTPPAAPTLTEPTNATPTRPETGTPSRTDFERTVSNWREEAAAVAGAEYRTVTWRGPTPPAYRAELARLRQQMSVDIPSAGLDVEEENWSEDRVASVEEIWLNSGYELLYTVALHEPSGALAGYTCFEWLTDKPEGVYQGDTYVDRGHRGKRLGLLMKAVNLEALLKHVPEVARIHTWNAGENEHMLAINEAMGFTPRSIEGAWEKRLG